jgi:glutathione synthase/RimK-type ligase-like ATP-grasp enzyme
MCAMNVFFVVNRPHDWPFQIPGVTTVSARAYLTESAYADHRSARVVNLCRSKRYQSRGYYVSLLAEARGHRPLPGVKAIEDLQADDPSHLLFGSFRDQLQQALASYPRAECALHAYFGRDPTGELDAVAQPLFEAFGAPLLQATLVRNGQGWCLRQARLLSAREIPPEHREFAAQAAAQYIAPHPRARNASGEERFAIAILHNEDTPDSPSNAAAIERFCAVAREMGMRPEVLGRGDIERLPEFDALFIRDTTWTNHYTYNFARRAQSEGLVVIDDPESILRCNNKVFLHELLARHNVALPRTLLVHRGNVDQIVPTLGLPCILKRPDSAFSAGVAKIGSAEELRAKVDALFGKSELLIAQEWLPTKFDWRVGVIDRRVLYVCKYLMAPGHWQVIKREAKRKVEGMTVALSIGEAPEAVVKTALRAANLIGDGFYGVDLKETDDQTYVIEVNDNPNVDAGNEDGVLKDALYREILGVFLRRIRERQASPVQ